MRVSAGHGRDQAASWRALLGAGINDWGGLSPLTRDFVNPEKPWPHLETLAEATADAGKALVPRCAAHLLHLQARHSCISCLGA